MNPTASPAMRNQPPPVDPPPLFSSADVTDDVLEQIENEVGMGSGAWDCVDPKEIVATAWCHIPVVKLKEDAAQQSVPASLTRRDHYLLFGVVEPAPWLPAGWTLRMKRDEWMQAESPDGSRWLVGATALHAMMPSRDGTITLTGETVWLGLDELRTSASFATPSADFTALVNRVSDACRQARQAGTDPTDVWLGPDELHTFNEESRRQASRSPAPLAAEPHLLNLRVMPSLVAGVRVGKTFCVG